MPGIGGVPGGGSRFGDTPAAPATQASDARVRRMLIDSRLTLTKLWFSVTRAEQRTRFAIRQIDPVRRGTCLRWTSSRSIGGMPTEAKVAMTLHTDTDHAPWMTIKYNDHKRARINAMRYLLSQFDYDGTDSAVVYPPPVLGHASPRH